MHRTNNSARPQWSQIAMLILLLATTWLYAHTLDFGFMWDDPTWFGRVTGESIKALVSPTPDYQFYRPVTMLYNRLFLRSDNTFSPPMLHAAQIGWHLLNVTLVYALSRRLGIEKRAALAVGGLVACYPFSYQAVAWAAPQQPMVGVLQNGAWLAYTEARRRKTGRGLATAISIFCFLLALFAQESTVALAVLPLLIEWRSSQRASDKNTGKADWWLALVYPLLAGGFGLLWLTVPRETGYTALTFDGSVALYVLQGLIFPLLGRPAGYAPSTIISPNALLALAALTLCGLLAVSHRAARGRQALLGLTWALLGVAPSVVGLRYSYVSLAPRLLYYSGPGVALLWVCALLPKRKIKLLDERNRKNMVSIPRRLWQSARVTLLILITLQSCLLIAGFRKTYTTGTTHMDELVETIQTENAHLLFINFPDRYAPKRPPYPLGYWGVTLAPISVDLGAFPAITVGKHISTTSRRMPPIDLNARETGPYQIDMRGEIAPPDEIYHLARQADAVYLSRYSPDGNLALHWAGDVISAPLPASCQLAQFGQTLCLQQAQVNPHPGQLSLTLTWRILSAAQSHDAIFAHVGTPYQPPIAQDDNDVWLGILPLAICQPGDVIREQRIILLPEKVELELYEIRIGVYNRITGERLPARSPQGETLLDDVFAMPLETNE